MQHHLYSYLKGEQGSAWGAARKEGKPCAMPTYFGLRPAYRLLGELEPDTKPKLPKFEDLSRFEEHRLSLDLCRLTREASVARALLQPYITDYYDGTDSQSTRPVNIGLLEERLRDAKVPFKWLGKWGPEQRSEQI